MGLYALLEGSDKRPRLLLVPPLLLALWANLHGGFPIGLVLVGCYLLAAAWAFGRRRVVSPGRNSTSGRQKPADTMVAAGLR